jgi:hypothetical protein
MTDPAPQEGELILYRTVDDTVRLENAGKMSAKVATRLDEEQYDMFRVRQDRAFENDFETQIETELKRIESKSPKKRREEP